jgi:hypothetical protein
MFQMTNDESVGSRDKQMAIVRVSALTIGLLVLGAVIYFLAFLPYAKG